MKYISTRNNRKETTSTSAIKLGMVPEGGLFVPASFPPVDFDQIKNLEQYKDLAKYILKFYLTDFIQEKLDEIVDQAYGDNFAHADVAPLKILEDNIGVLELIHGPTAAFKDLALQCMPQLLVHSMEVQQEKNRVLVLVATSGDTGTSAIEGFINKKNAFIIVFYPETGVSAIQKQQMITANGDNVVAVGVRGNFDECQAAVKRTLGDKDLRQKALTNEIIFSSANSINWGRLAPQIAYYFWAYLNMVKKGVLNWNSKVNLCVPTGNFGNILAGFYAYKMGLPVNKFICASNSNNILTDFINTGEYKINRDFFVTSSPSMDILISSNLERFIFDIYANDGQKVEKLYKKLQENKVFNLDHTQLKNMQSLFYGNFASEKDTFTAIKSAFDKYRYVLDPHTAVGWHVLQKYRMETSDPTPVILTATASPFKFPVAVLDAITGKRLANEYEALYKLADICGMPVHKNLDGIDKRSICHNRVIDKDQIVSFIDNESKRF